MLNMLSVFVMQHWVLCATGLGLLVLLGVNEWWSQRQSPRQISAQEVVSHINDQGAVVIDIRAQDAYDGGHMTGAIRIASDDKKRFKPYQAKSIVLVCQRGITAMTLAQTLKKEGFQSVMVLKGGMSAWQAEGLPTIKKNNVKGNRS